MRAKLFTVLILTCLWTSALIYDRVNQPGKSLAKPINGTQKSEIVPDIAFTTIKGESFRLRDLPGKGIVLHFWASWCIPCAVELPKLLNQIHENSGKIALVAISIDDDPKAMNDFVKKLRGQDQAFAKPYIYFAWDQHKEISLKIFNTTNVPETILINKDHIMINKIVGDPDWTSSESKERLRMLTQ